ncbi:hypothetical protein QTP86_000669 [Hemibagrus guttatus]|nr:hypothetical protein QTP86_000669 [Hemibagrus guttatus]
MLYGLETVSLRKRQESELEVAELKMLSAYTWSGLLKHLRQMLIANARMEEGAFKEPGLYVPWLPADGTFHTWHSPVPFSGYEKLATLLSNSQSLLNPLDNMVKKAWSMFASRHGPTVTASLREQKRVLHNCSSFISSEVINPKFQPAYRLLSPYDFREPTPV